MTAIQDRLFPALTCFGCGPANPDGLQLKSYVADGYVAATFTPRPEHDNGAGYLNGGIIATLLDCHSAAAVMHLAAGNGWEPAPGSAMPFVTAAIDVRYLRPSPLDREVGLHALIREAGPREIICHTELRHDGKTCATGRAVWKRWQPR